VADFIKFQLAKKRLQKLTVQIKFSVIFYVSFTEILNATAFFGTNVCGMIGLQLGETVMSDNYGKWIKR
jgi:hypothetical protein